MELVRLRIKDVDFDHHRLCVRDGSAGTGVPELPAIVLPPMAGTLN